MVNTRKIIWLSHSLDSSTPGYGGKSSFELNSEKQISCGDSCNTAQLTLSNHAGTHVDLPFHFINNGKTIDDYQPVDWVFSQPLIIDIPLESDEIISEKQLAGILKFSQQVDLILFRTGFEHYRQDERYWKSAPGFAPDLAKTLKAYFPNLKAIGMDTLSLTSFQHRDLGREAHQAFLGLDLRIFEDLSLMNIPNDQTLTQVIALPLRFQKADGAPCTMIGFMD